MTSKYFENQQITVKGSGVVALLITLVTFAFAFGGWVVSLQSDINILKRDYKKQEIYNAKTEQRYYEIKDLLMQDVSVTKQNIISMKKDIEFIKDEIKK